MTFYENTTCWFRKVYGCRKHLEFTTFCLKNDKIPNFVKISYTTIRVNKLNLEDIRKLQLRRLEFADKKTQEKLKINEFIMNKI